MGEFPETHHVPNVTASRSNPSRAAMTSGGEDSVYPASDIYQQLKHALGTVITTLMIRLPDGSSRHASLHRS